MTHSAVAPRVRTFARDLRVNGTEAEQKLWRVLRDRRLAGLKWRRQVPLGRYIVDFVCLERRLVVECDGSHHADSRDDVLRDRWLADQGFSVVRFWNHEVLQTPGIVIDTLRARLDLPV